MLRDPAQPLIRENREYKLRVYDAALAIRCAACGAPAGELCITCLGLPADAPHSKRRRYGTMVVAREDEREQAEAVARIRDADYSDIIKK